MCIRDSNSQEQALCTQLANFPINFFEFNTSIPSKDPVKDFLAKHLEMKYPLRQIHVRINWEEYQGEVNIGCTKIVQSLSQLSSLTQVIFNLKNTPFNDEGCYSLAQLLHSRISLSRLTIYLQNTRITDRGISFLADGLQRLKQLSYLSLSFSENNNNITDEGGVRFSQSLSSLTKLTILTIDFSRCKIISDMTAQSLATNLRNCLLLTGLGLWFGSTSITSKGVLSLSKSISCLEHLIELTLEFDRFFSFAKIKSEQIKSYQRRGKF
eukprot:TRINITY_DN8976_c0_g1_i3.p1 TRINITY_DN8976_c0_g1~~TRINITY_DN8976_c0_g1_i3.p1  ORF type:complete len:288 (-),score=18.78 TRINITY_DN8976_c0_g1_i3:116-919(-)